MTNDHRSIEEERKEIRKFLPFWVREILAMKDEAEGKNRVREPSEREGS
jgi:hypothetical protein